MAEIPDNEWSELMAESSYDEPIPFELTESGYAATENISNMGQGKQTLHSHV